MSTKSLQLQSALPLKCLLNVTAACFQQRAKGEGFRGRQKPQEQCSDLCIKPVVFNVSPFQFLLVLVVCLVRGSARTTEQPGLGLGVLFEIIIYYLYSRICKPWPWPKFLFKGQMQTKGNVGF